MIRQQQQHYSLLLPPNARSKQASKQTSKHAYHVAGPNVPSSSTICTAVPW